MKILQRTLLTLGYCVPYVFLAMNEDAVTGTPNFYFVMIICLGFLCFLCKKTDNKALAIYGNILSFISSCVFAWIFKTEKWEWYFKPFLPNQLIIFESLIILIIHIVILFKKNKTQTN